jgi:hypothetical protein
MSRREPWSFEDGPAVLARIQREYAQSLLTSLPDPGPETGCPEPLRAAYRSVALLMVRLVRQSQSASAGPLSGHAEDARALLASMHAYLVARQLRALRLVAPMTPDLDLALQAEQQVESFLLDLDISGINELRKRKS